MPSLIGRYIYAKKVSQSFILPLGGEGGTAFNFKAVTDEGIPEGMQWIKKNVNFFPKLQKSLERI